MPIQTATQAIENQSSGIPFGFKNRIINGDMRIDQRTAGASVTPTSGGYFSIDRWRASQSASSKYSMQRNAGSVALPVGFTNYLGITSTSAYSLAAGDYFRVLQNIEGFNTADLGWGTVDAAPVTLSFWVRSSLTGTFGGTIQNVTGTRSYPYTYTINNANTWEYETITIPGETTGNWLTDNNTGILVGFGIGVGSTYSAAAGSWTNADYASATGATSVVSTNGATFYITGVQLEKGIEATPFDYRPYGTELALCQKYYYKASSTSNGVLGFGYNTATNEGAYGIPFPVTMRSVPTFTSSAANTFLCQDSANRVPTVVGLQTASVSMASVVFTISGATAGFGSKLLDGTSANVAFSAEL
jgi:hypothetical protein